MRKALGLLLAATLTGCSRPGDLLTPRPLLTAKDAVGAPKFRSGVWRALDAEARDSLCNFDETKPIKAWPDCAASRLIALDRMIGFGVVKTPLGPMLTERSFPYRLAAGSPLLLQRYGDYPGRYSYDAVDQMKLDPQGRVVAARLSRINCFDPTATAAATTDATMNDIAPKTVDSAAPTPRLKPGFSQTAKGECRARDLAALRNAAAADAAASSESVNFRWVRDGDR